MDPGNGDIILFIFKSSEYVLLLHYVSVNCYGPLPVLCLKFQYNKILFKTYMTNANVQMSFNVGVTCHWTKDPSEM